MSITIKIYQDNVLRKEFNNKEDSNIAFRWLLNNQGSSVDYAIRWGGWKVEEINEQTNEVELWKPYPRIEWRSTSNSIDGYLI
mgnify:CR=1 FL=1